MVFFFVFQKILSVNNVVTTWLNFFTEKKSTAYKENKFIRKNLIDDEELNNELLWGYFFHYLIGIIYGIIFVIINFLLFDYPSILLAYIFGFSTVLGGWCFLMPFAYNLGFFASKSDQRTNLLVQNLIAHFVFGTGLFIGIYIFN